VLESLADSRGIIYSDSAADSGWNIEKASQRGDGKDRELRAEGKRNRKGGRVRKREKKKRD